MLNRRKFGFLTLAAFAGGTAFSCRSRAANANALATLSDGHLELPSAFLVPEPTRLELGVKLDETLTPACNVAVLRSENRLVLFDAGSGPNFMPTAGRLPASLDVAGIDPGDVTDVIFTHAHPDHIWGVVDDFDDPLFANATHHVASDEWNFWRSERALSDLPEERHSFVAGARNRFDAIEETVSLFEPGDEPVPGVEAMAAFGHTPGHMAFIVHGGEPAMIVGDAISNDPISFLRPDLPWGADQDGDKGAATRMRLLDRAAGEGIKIIGFHLPNGGIGHVERQDAAYRFVGI
ncbi:MBL fold metallo-hydrolase [Jiella sp. 40Bstr34]|uniref:MBL fold metallo-hydrolase n=1 Tax=Jiella pacifica TaxID=2696469 RepID=A0A6N9SVS8_9HYPH|nr:MBL fold metallo-hydrolase [Jiella pacifica]